MTHIARRVNRKQNKRLSALEKDMVLSQKDDVSSTGSDSRIHTRLRKLEAYMEANPTPVAVSVVIEKDRIETIEAVAREQASQIAAFKEAMAVSDSKVNELFDKTTRVALKALLGLPE